MKTKETKTMKHTPGPHFKLWSQGRTLMTAQTKRWPVEQIRTNDAVESLMIFEGFTAEDQGRGRRLIARVAENHPNAPENATLIAAAPELLDCLKRLLAKCDESWGIPGIWPATRDDARDAIAKAEGLS